MLAEHDETNSAADLPIIDENGGERNLQSDPDFASNIFPAMDYFDAKHTSNTNAYRESIAAGFMYEERHYCSDFKGDKGGIFGLCTAYCTQCSDENRFLRRGLKNDNRCQVLLNNYQKMIEKFQSSAPDMPPC